jgi:hypothetical protein
MLEVTLRNGLVLTTPLSQFPRLRKGTARQRSQWELICNGTGIHWEALDEDISVNGLLNSFLRRLPHSAWRGVSRLKSRGTGKLKVTIPA